MIKDSAYEIPMYTTDAKTSIVRSFDIKTDISNRISSMIAIAANPTVDSQVGLGKDTSDFGIYNLGTEDRYKTYTVDSTEIGPDKNIKDNGQMAQIAINFNKVVNTIYSSKKGRNLTASERSNLTNEEIDRATNYYIERMSYVKNQQSGSVHSLVIPIKSSITMDGISSLYPFQLYTIPEILLPYRYSVSNLDKKVGFSITKLIHSFEGSQWTTQFEGLMTLLKDPSYYEPDKEIRKATTQTRTASGGYTAKDTSSQKTNIEIIMKLLRKRGYNDYAVAAIIGNLKAENSTLNPKLITTEGGKVATYGIAQWRDINPGGRIYKLETIGKINGEVIDPTTLEGQVKFLIYEMDTTERFAGDRLKFVKSLPDALAAMAMFERFADVIDIQKQEAGPGGKITDSVKEKTYLNILNKLNTQKQPESNEWGFRVAYAQDIYNKIQSKEYKYN
jgi:hypothetical protein